MTDLLDRPLTIGRHSSKESGACIIEWLRLHENLSFSDSRLDCQSPVLHRALVRFNDAMPAEPRQQLKLIGLRSLGTADDGRDQTRAYLCADWAVRVAAPFALEAAGLVDEAARLRELAPLVDEKSARAAAYAARAANVAYGAAAYYVARAAADAANAANAAADAAYDAAANAAYAAADAAAAAVDASRLWSSALELLDRLIAPEAENLV